MEEESLDDGHCSLDNCIFFGNNIAGNTAVDGADIKNYHNSSNFDPIIGSSLQLSSASVYDTQYGSTEPDDYNFVFGNSFSNTTDPMVPSLSVATCLPPYIADPNFDDDGVCDIYDLDDDNDGILDVDELEINLINQQPTCNAVVMDFSGSPTLMEGVDLQPGAVYKYLSIDGSVDAKVTIVSNVNQTVATIDDNDSDASFLMPGSILDLDGNGDQSYTEYLIEFVTGDGETPVVYSRFFVNFNDIDGILEFGEQNWVLSPNSYTTDNPTDLTTIYGDWICATAGIMDYSGTSNINPPVNASVVFVNKSEIRIRLGAVNRYGGTIDHSRSHSIEFACVSNFTNPTTSVLDFDEDNYLNHHDLDSDNDGIFDCVEAGHSEVSSNGIILGAVDSFGIPIAVSDGMGGVNYIYSNSDGLEFIDAYSIDADNDGCTDVIEAGFPDSDGDGKLGGLVPPNVDTEGRVTSGGE